jgi:membrane protease subunit HflK
MLIGDRGIFDVIGRDRTAIESSCTDLLNEKFRDYNFGINVTTVKLQSVLAPVGAVQDAFEDVNKAQQDMNRLINEGKEAYNKEIPKARGEAEKLIQEAKGYAAERENMAIGDVARFNSVYNEYRNNRSVTRTRLYIEMVEDVFKEKENTDLIDKNLKNFVPFKGLQNEGGAR